MRRATCNTLKALDLVYVYLYKVSQISFKKLLTNPSYSSPSYNSIDNTNLSFNVLPRGWL